MAGVGAAEFARSKKRKELPNGLVRDSCDQVSRILERKKGPKAGEILKKTHQLTWKHAAIVREAEGLKKGLSGIERLREELNGAVGSHSFEVLEIKNLCLTAEVAIRAALAREETRGTHLRMDFPGAREEMSRKHVSLSYSSDGELQTTIVPSRM